MISKISIPTWPAQYRWLATLLAIASLFVFATCGGGGGRNTPPPEDNVTIAGVTDDGSGNAPIPNAVCSFLDSEGAEQHSDVTDADGAYRLVVPPELRGHIICSPRSAPNLTLSTFSSTIGSVAGDAISSENVTPATTVVADIIHQENSADPEGRKAELLNDIVTHQDANLEIVVAMAERLYKAMLGQQIDVAFGGNRSGDGGDGGGSSDSDVGGASGDAGDGADFSPLVEATCEFVVGDTLATGERITSAALADFIADGLLNRPDLAAVADEVNQGVDAGQIQAAFDQVFSQGLGLPVQTLTDGLGHYSLPVPPNMAGYIRCTPKDREQLVLGTYFPGRSEDETIENQDINPALTVFSTDIAPHLIEDLATTKENFLADIEGLATLLSGPNLPEGPLTDVRLGTDTMPANNEVGLVAFAVTTLFNAFNKNDLDVDFLAAIAELRENSTLSTVFLTAQGVPAGDAEALADLINASITQAAGLLGTDLATAWSTGRVNVTVMDAADGRLIEDATIDIVNDLACPNCGSQTDANGQLQLTIGGLDATATDIVVEVSGVEGFETANFTKSIAAFATVDLEARLADPQTDILVPTIGISSPSTSPILTNTSSIDLQGTAADDVDVTSVVWSSDRGDSGTCSGTTAWRADNIPLAAGANVITVTASDAAGNTATDVVTVILDMTVPTLIVTIPDDSPVTTRTGALDIQGTAADDEGISEVRWSNDQGGRGTCSGTNTWSASGIVLQEGANAITVTAEDGAGNTTTATVTVNYEPLWQLTILGSGSGGGSVSASALGITCSIDGGSTSGTCSDSFPSGTTVTLDVDPSNSVFTGWGGPCSGTDGCSFTLNQDQSVTAAFIRRCGEGDVSIGSSSASFPEGGGTGSFDVTAPDDCAWTADEDDGWITLTTGTGIGNGTVAYQVSSNNGTSSRSGHISVSGHRHNVEQTWSDFIADWRGAGLDDGDISRVLIVDNGNSGLRVSPYYRCEEGTSDCELSPQTVDDPGAGPISFSNMISDQLRLIVTLTLRSPTALHASYFSRYTTGDITIDGEPIESDLVPD